MDFKARYDSLNSNQRQAVDHIDGPLLVLAGPGTGKTELLSMRTANILLRTDTLPSNILCLTFTDSAANNMRRRLQSIIGEDAYKVAIHTFHSFGTEIIANNREYFFRGTDRRPTDDLRQMQIMTELFQSLDRSSLLASQNDGQFVHLKDAMSVISEFKKSGLVPNELRAILEDNQRIYDVLSPKITEVFSQKITKNSLEPFSELASSAAAIQPSKLPTAITSYAETISLSLAHAVKDALSEDSTKPITAWKNLWCTKDAHKNTVLKDAESAKKLAETIDLYEAYETKLAELGLFDYDDMILSVLAALREYHTLSAQLQEQFQYIMVDEFQDTNLAQLRLLFELTGAGCEPNVMAVGDDDQAVYSFQGADVGNIQRFRDFYDDPPIVVLGDNYRSTHHILTAARYVIQQGTDRLEHTIADLSKDLTAHVADDSSRVAIHSYASPIEERASVAEQIASLIENSEQPSEITVLARKHQELIELLPYLADKNISVNYERSDDVFEQPIIRDLELLSRVVVSISGGSHDQANALLPELVAHPSFGFDAVAIWRLSLSTYKNRQTWLEGMLANDVFEPFATWLITLAKSAKTESLEQIINQFLQPWIADGPSLMEYYFAPQSIDEQPGQYLLALESLRTLRDRLREHFTSKTPDLADMVRFIDLHRDTETRLATIRHQSTRQDGSINLMSAHKAKGLEYKHVFVIGATDKTWGEKARDRVRNIRYPANLPLAPAGANYDERLRLFFVAMTRAKTHLMISFARSDITGRDNLVASFLSSSRIEEVIANDDPLRQVELAKINWRDRLTAPMTTDLRQLLAPTLEHYKLSATHLGNFLDISRGGPQNFLLNNLLKFPQVKSAAASYGTAIHTTLQNAHNLVRVGGVTPPIDTVLADFRRILESQQLAEADFEQYLKKGEQALTVFMREKSSSFSPTQQVEVSFASQGVVVVEARLTGSLDLIDVDKTAKEIIVTDYKTGGASRDWRGKGDYEKIKLHKYRQQLMFYQLLVEGSRDFSDYRFAGGVLQFVEPEPRTSEILSLNQTFTSEELSEFRALIERVWQRITTLELPDVSGYSADFAGVLEFEQDLLNQSTQKN